MKTMNNMKKFASILLALVMVLAMAAPAMAANSNAHTITINNTTAGYTYEAYRVFEGTIEGNQLTAIAWSDGVNATALMTALKQIPDFANCETAADVANVLNGITAANDATTQAFADAVADNLGTVAGSASTVTDGKYVINVTGDGYYFVKTTAVPQATGTTSEGVHTRYILKVVGDVEVTHKGTVPQVEKKIVETTGDVDSTDKNIGDTVDFKLTATLPSDYDLFKTYTLTFHDTMSEGLTNARDFVVKVVDAATGAETTVETSSYNVVNPAIDGHSFDVVIANVKAITAAGAGDKIVVTYKATVGTDAVIGNPGNDNKVKLEYSNNPNEEQGGTPETGETPEDKVVVFTYELNVNKVDSVDNSIKLEGAKFSLFNADESKIAKFNGNKLVEWVDKSTVTATEGVYPDEYTLTTNENGLIEIEGLDAGTYKLLETVAPTGYNLPSAAFTVVITATTSETGITALSGMIDSANMSADTNAGLVTGTIENTSGAQLPETGGMGTTLIYAVGALLVAGAVVVMISKKRAASK